ncbi:hypothetical protein HDU97_006995 [Phlyctochytrium planicorne]|nr:hypothetical protein HDU97_006995 [Phlyctochytrium planicorne]
MIKAIQDLQQSEPIPIPRKSPNPAAGIKPHPTAHYVALQFTNSLLPSYVLNQNGTVFSDCHFGGAQWSRPASGSNNHQTSVKFENCDLKGCNFHHVVLDDCRWKDCNVQEVNFKHCRFLRAAKFVNCDLRNANFEGARFYRLEFVDCRLDGCNFKDVFVHTLTLDGPKTSLRSADVLGLLISNIVPLRADFTDNASNNGLASSAPGSPASASGILVSTSLPSTPKLGRKTPGSESSSPPSHPVSFAAATSHTMSMPDLLGNNSSVSSSSLISFPDPLTLSQPFSASSSDYDGFGSPESRASPIPPNLSIPSPDHHGRHAAGGSMLSASPVTNSPTGSPTHGPLGTTTLSSPVPDVRAASPTPEEQAAAKEAETAAAAAVAKQTSAPLPLADLLHLSWKGAYFGTGAWDLQQFRTKAKRSQSNASGSNAGTPVNGALSSSPGNMNGFGKHDFVLPPSGAAATALPANPPMVAQPGWARTMACLQKIAMGDYR